MKTEEFVYEDDYLDVTVVVSEATVLHGIKRTRLRLEGRESEGDDPDRRLLALFTYPDLLAATESVEGELHRDGGEPFPWPLGFETFLRLPDRFISEWEKAVYRLNPHWIAGAGDGDEKKAQSSTGD